MNRNFIPVMVRLFTFNNDGNISHEYVHSDLHAYESVS